MGFFNRWARKRNAFEEFDKRGHLKPKINKTDFYQLTGFKFGWHQEFRDGVEHGKTENYEEGKVIEVKHYENGTLVSTKKIK